MIDANRETLVSLAGVPALLPERRGSKRPHVSCIYRWCQRGVRGIKLEWLQCGGTKVTSTEAIQRFFDRLTQLAGNANATTDDADAPVNTEAPATIGTTATKAPATASARKRASDKAAAALEKAGW